MSLPDSYWPSIQRVLVFCKLSMASVNVGPKLLHPGKSGTDATHARSSSTISIGYFRLRYCSSGFLGVCRAFIGGLLRVGSLVVRATLFDESQNVLDALYRPAREFGR